MTGESLSRGVITYRDIGVDSRSGLIGDASLILALAIKPDGVCFFRNDFLLRTSKRCS